MTVSLIVAVSANGVIGKDNDLIWYLPRDLNYFKRVTENHVVVMGRRNYESIPEKYRPLPKRTNVIVTRQSDYDAPECELVSSVEKGIELANKLGDQEPFIIGGGQIYQYALDQNLIDRMYITEVHQRFEGDTYFPEVNTSVWKEVSREDHPADNRHDYAYSFVVYEKK
jgi:dihydrofolate reductase